MTFLATYNEVIATKRLARANYDMLCELSRKCNENCDKLSKQIKENKRAIEEIRQQIEFKLSKSGDNENRTPYGIASFS